MKTCKHCGQEGEFYKNRANKDGLASWCKKCSAKDRKKYMRDYQRERRGTPEVIARNKFRNAYVQGKVPKPRFEAHHTEYSEPLFVFDLQRKYHRNLHALDWKSIDLTKKVMEQ
jgi:hypothetical protein